MTGRVLRLSIVPCVLVLVATALAGCGTASESAPVLDNLTQVADRTADVGSASFELRVDQSLGAQKFTLSAHGAFDTAANRARLSVDLSSLAKLFTGLGQAFGAPKGTLQGFDDPASWKVEVLRLGTKVYVSTPLLDGSLPTGKTWVSGDLAKLGAEHGLDLGQLGAVGKADPRDVLGLLRAASGDLDRIGTETIRGVETTHYRATLDPDEVAKLAGKNAGDRLVDGLTGAIEKSGLHAVPIDVWVDGDSRLRRLEATVDAEPRGMPSSTRLSLELYDYGEPVEVTPPPASSVADVDTLRAHG